MAGPGSVPPGPLLRLGWLTRTGCFRSVISWLYCCSGGKRALLYRRQHTPDSESLVRIKNSSQEQGIPLQSSWRRIESSWERLAWAALRSLCSSVNRAGTACVHTLSVCHSARAPVCSPGWQGLHERRESGGLRCGESSTLGVHQGVSGENGLAGHRSAGQEAPRQNLSLQEATNLYLQPALQLARRQKSWGSPGDICRTLAVA
jgi:hypothetical protein